jgi:hypothetical protein
LCIAAVLIGLGPVNDIAGSAITRFIDKDARANQPKDPPSLAYAYDALCIEANHQRAELSALHDWASQQGKQEHADQISALRASMLEGWARPALTISYPVYGKTVNPVAYPEYTDDDLWQSFYVLSELQREYRQKILELRVAIYQDMGVQVRPQRSPNPFDRNRQP